MEHEAEPAEALFPPHAKRALVVILLAVVVLAGAGLAYLHPQPNSAGQTSGPAAHDGPADYRLVNVDFVDPAHGWALLEGPSRNFAVLRTTNAGATWSRQVGGSAGEIGEYMRFFDRSHGVVSTLGFGTTLLLTADAGSTWQRSEPLAGGGWEVLSASFVDARTGWLLTLGGDGFTQRLWRTPDGGATWVNLGRPVRLEDTAYRVVFSDRDHGWLYARSIGPYVYGTDDGGLTWARTVLPSPKGAWPVAPKSANLPEQFFVTARPTRGTGVVASVIPIAPPQGRSAAGGVVVAYPPLKVHAFDGGRDVTYVYRTSGDTSPSRYGEISTTVNQGSLVAAQREGNVEFTSRDAGRTWSFAAPPCLCGAIGFIDESAWWWIGSGQWSKSSDGGQTWDERSGLGVPEPLTGSLQVLDATHAVFGVMAGSRPLIESTDDGGRRWTMSYLPPITA